MRTLHLEPITALTRSTAPHAWTARGAPRHLVRRRRGRLRPVAWSLASVTLAVGLLGLATGSELPGAGSGADAGGGVVASATIAQDVASRAGGMDVAATPVTTADIAVEEATVGPTLVFATVSGVELRLPSHRPVLVAYHEASNDHGFVLAPIGRVLANRNPTRTVPTAGNGEVEFLILSSRGRPAPATSAVDVVLADDDVVRSPVDGVVVDVRWYLLYGRHLDRRIEIAAHGRDDLRIVVLHVEDLLVAEGDEVAAGVTPLSVRARQLPFSSHVDREVPGGRHPHVHVEAVGPDAPRPDPVGG